MVVHQPLKGVQAFGAAGGEQGQAGRGGEHGGIAQEGDVADLVGQQAVLAREHGAGAQRSGRGVEQREAVGGGDVHRMAQRVGDDAINAEEMVILEVLGAVGPATAKELTILTSVPGLNFPFFVHMLKAM